MKIILAAYHIIGERRAPSAYVIKRSVVPGSISAGINTPVIPGLPAGFEKIYNFLQTAEDDDQLNVSILIAGIIVFEITLLAGSYTKYDTVFLNNI